MSRSGDTRYRRADNQSNDGRRQIKRFEWKTAEIRNKMEARTQRKSDYVCLHDLADFEIQPKYNLPTGCDTFKETKHALDARLAVQRLHQMHLGRAGIGKARGDARVGEHRDQRVGAGFVADLRH